MHTARRTTRGYRRRRSGNPLFGQLLTAAVESAAEAVAIRSAPGDDPDSLRELTYREFDEASSRLARELIARGIGPGDGVVVGIGRSIESVLSVWAIAKTGAVCVPVDPAGPPERMARIVAESGVALGLTTTEYRAALGGEVAWLELDEALTSARIAARAPHPISYTDRVRLLTEQHPAYLGHTSGSAASEGVVVTHTGLATVVNAIREQLAVDGDSRIAHLSPPDADVSVLELMLAFSSGATLIVTPPAVSGAEELADLLRREQVTHLLATADTLGTVDPSGLDDLEAVAVIGDRCDPALVGRWALDGRACHIAYGHPEATILNTVSGALRPGEIRTIGTPIAGVGAFVLDSRLRPVPAGMVGELYLSGPVLAQGYSGYPASTAERFVAGPFGAETGQSGLRLFRTGDLVRRNGSDGAMEFVGRVPERAPAIRKSVAAAVERTVAEIFAALLAPADGRVGESDDFFELGGDSPLAAEAAALLSAALQLWVPVRFVFETPTVRALAGRVGRYVESAAARGLRPMPRPGRIPLSYAQHRPWLRNRLDPASDIRAAALRLSGRLDIAALRAAVRDLVLRHEILRTVYPEFGGEGYQLVLPITDPRAAPDVPVFPVTAAELPGALAQTVGTDFDVTTAPPVRLRALALSDTEHVLMCVVHHVVADDFSMSTLTRDLLTAYRERVEGGQPRWAALEVQYADYALWQRAALGTADDPDSLLAQQLQFWREELAGLPGQSPLPEDQPRPEIVSRQGARLDFEIGARVHAALHRLAHEHGVTVFMLAHAVLAVLLARLSGMRDIAIGASTTGRGEAALAEVIGVFADTLVLRTSIDPDVGFAELLTRLRQTDLVAFDHADVPFEQLAEQLDPVRRAAGRPLVPIVLTVGSSGGQARPELPELIVTDIEFDTASTGFDMQLTLTEHVDDQGAAQGMAARFTYATDLFDEETVRDIAQRLGRVIDAVLADDTVIVGDIDVLVPGERELVLREWHTAGAEVPPMTLADLIVEQARARPGAVAIRCGDIAVSFGELLRRANRVARALIECGVGPESLVAVAVERNVELPLALLGVLLSGAGYVPVDIGSAAQRVQFVLDDAAPECLLTSAQARLFLPHSEIPVVLLEEVERCSDAPLADADRIAPLRQQNPACVLYRPDTLESVILTHRNVLELLANARPLFDIAETDVWTLSHSYADALSVWELWGALATGATIVVLDHPTSRSPESLRELLIREQVTVLNQTPPEFDALVEADRAASGSGSGSAAGRLALRYVVSGGAAPDPTSLRRWYERHSADSPQLATMYGIAETTVHTAFFAVDEQMVDDPVNLIGRALPGSACFVLDERLHPSPMGVTGEMYLAGGQLARGYPRRAGLTATRFVANPFGEPGSRMYRSGDIGRWIGFGGAAALEYVEHRDRQVNAGRSEPVETEDPSSAGDTTESAYAAPELIRTDLGVSVAGTALAQTLATIVEADPDRPALMSGADEMSYRELDARSSRLARALIARDCGPGVGVAVRFDRGADAAVAVWAVLKVGAAVIFPVEGAALPVEPGVRLGLTGVVRDPHDTIDWLVLADPDVGAQIAAESARPVTCADRTRALRGGDLAFVTADTVLGYDQLAAAVDRLCSGTELNVASRTFHRGAPQSPAALLEIVAAGASGAAVMLPENAGGSVDTAALAGHWVTHLFTDAAGLASLDPEPLEDLVAVVLDRGPVPARGFGAAETFMVLDELIR